jgi:CheY-like chemotaxis protein
MKVLHVDDSPEICELYSDMFTADNHTVRSVNDGKEGLELVIKNDYDLILLDMCMPKFSGFDFLRGLKTRRPSELKKVVVVSVLEFNEAQVQELLKYGIHSVEEKPSSIQRLEVIQKNITLNSMKVLLVDDNPDITCLLSKFLKAKGCDNEITNDPQDALEKIKNKKYDYIFLDIHMPGLSGLDIIQTLETEHILKDQKIVIFSAHDFKAEEIQELLKKEGIEGYLKKPVQLNALIATMVR